jgi:hypothetical protein
VWQGTGGSAKLVARKGVQANGLATGVLWNRILKYWPVGDQVIVFGVVKGPGVSAANDQVVVLFQSDATSKLLMREGDLAPGCDGLKIGVIQQVQASMSGNYLVLASLTGAKSDSNQALFGGDATAGTTSNFGIRLPLLKLRKGTRYQSVIGTAARLKNITMSALGTDSSGVGGKGLSHSVNDDGDIAITLDLDNGGRQLVRGQL